MTRLEFEEFLSDSVNIKFANTFTSEFYIHYRKHNILFMDKRIKYQVFDKDGNEVDPTSCGENKFDTEDVCDSVIFSQNLDPIVSDSCITYLPCKTTYNELKIGLRDSYQLNKNKLQEWLKYVKNEYLKTDVDVTYGYWKDESKLYHWTLDFLTKTSDLEKLLAGYKSAALEPDGNIMWEYKKKMVSCLDELDKLYNKYWENK